jgi:hypothetical protein
MATPVDPKKEKEAAMMFAKYPQLDEVFGVRRPAASDTRDTGEVKSAAWVAENLGAEFQTSREKAGTYYVPGMTLKEDITQRFSNRGIGEGSVASLIGESQPSVKLLMTDEDIRMMPAKHLLTQADANRAILKDATSRAKWKGMLTTPDGGARSVEDIELAQAGQRVLDQKDARNRVKDERAAQEADVASQKSRAADLAKLEKVPTAEPLLAKPPTAKSPPITSEIPKVKPPAATAELATSSYADMLNKIAEEPIRKAIARSGANLKTDIKGDLRKRLLASRQLGQLNTSGYPQSPSLATISSSASPLPKLQILAKPTKRITSLLFD